MHADTVPIPYAAHTAECHADEPSDPLNDTAMEMLAFLILGAGALAVVVISIIAAAIWWWLRH